MFGRTLEIADDPTDSAGLPHGSATAFWLISLTPLGLFFTANDGVRGTEPWISDGTAAGTAMLKDVKVGPLSSGGSRFFAAGSRRVYFIADDFDHGVELWETDGTTAGTVLAAYSASHTTRNPTLKTFWYGR